jgi:branched-chain amino acid transport system substrate-binding protein
VSQTDLASAFPDLHSKPLNAFLVTPLVDKSVEILKAIRGDGFGQIVIGGNSFNTLGIADAAGPAVEGAYVGAAWNPGVESAASKRFVDAYTKKYGMAPDLFAAQGYSSVYLLLDGLMRAGTTEHAALRDALAAIKDVETPLGSVTISANREAVHEPVIQRYDAGKLVVLP